MVTSGRKAKNLEAAWPLCQVLPPCDCEEFPPAMACFFHHCARLLHAFILWIVSPRFTPQHSSSVTEISAWGFATPHSGRYVRNIRRKACRLVPARWDDHTPTNLPHIRQKADALHHNNTNHNFIHSGHTTTHIPHKADACVAFVPSSTKSRRWRCLQEISTNRCAQLLRACILRTWSGRVLWSASFSPPEIHSISSFECDGEACLVFPHLQHQHHVA